MPTATVVKNARRYERISLPMGMFVAWYSVEDQQISRVQTLGLGGLFICVPSAPPVGTNLRLVFEIPGGSFQAEGIVRNVKPGEGMGVEFVKVNARDRISLKFLMKRLLR
jgi:hypothetical protein